MRFAFVPIVILAASFSLVAAQTATVDQSAAYFKIDVMRPPPPPTSVYVLNFPDVQTVSGTVSVDNLPAVQTVGGTVNVGNLPLDAEGAVRVTSAPTRQPVLVEAIPPGGVTIQPVTDYTSPSVNTAGYSWVGLIARGNNAGPEVHWRWEGTGADDFGPILDNRNWPSSNCNVIAIDSRVVCVVSGVEVRFHLRNTALVPIRLDSVQVYLIP